MPSRASPSTRSTAVHWVRASLGIAFAAAPASAQTTPEAIRLEYSAFAEECPDAGAFFDRMRARTAVTPANADESARTFRVLVAPRGAAIEATLEVIAIDGTSSARSLAGPSCDEVVSAAALVAALAIEEHAGSRAIPAPDANARSTERIEAPPRVPIERPAPEAVVRFRAAAAFKVALGRTPDVLFGVSVAIALRRESPGALVAGPAFRLSFAIAPSASVSNGAETARFGWWTASLDGCPISLVLAPGLFVEPCAVLEAGALAASGDRVANAVSETRPWFSAGASARATWRVASGFGLELGTGFEVPFVRDRFYFGAGTTILRVPAIAFLFDLGASWTFL
jgi:hypothetical protein